MAKKSQPIAEKTVEETAPKKKAAPRKSATSGRKTASKTTTKRSAARVPRAVAYEDGSNAAGKNLLIVESPAKARTIEKYLGSEFKVVASVGHVIDLPPTRLGVDIEEGFKPEYVVIKGKQSIIDNMKRQAKAARAVYLAPDPDREGEAIAFHIAEHLKDANDHIYRATFNEITKAAVRQAIQEPRQIDTNLFNAQQARRILDRLVGYKLSPLLWRKVRRGLSAGRVQSVAVRLICDRERDIRAFVTEEYWTIEGLALAHIPPTFVIHLDRINGKKAAIDNKAAADAILAELKTLDYKVGDVIKKDVAKRPFAPFITSTLQQEASRKLKFPAARTMSIAQKLYEGIELGAEGSVGLITYMRTDSTRLSNEAVGNIRDFIRNAYGERYVPENWRVYTTKKSAQDAHEAIRPTDITLTPDKVAQYLEPAALDLYTLIWKRSVACQMVDATLERTRIEVPAGRFLFVANGSVIKFEGYLRVYQEGRDESGKSESDNEGFEPVQLDDDETLPPVAAGDPLKIEKMNGLQHFTQPPPRYTEAGLIRELEKQGIGRPSTYAAIISTIQEKEYVNKESGTFRPTELGDITTGLLTESFPHIMDIKFTAMMEDQLDRVEDGAVNWVELLQNFYDPFARTLEEAGSKMRDVKKEVVETEHKCDKCGSPMVIRWGRNGKFLACSAFPKCRNTKPIIEDAEGNVSVAEPETTDKVCPECGRPMAVKSGRRGRFLACTGYPDCKTTQPYPIGAPCGRPGCGGELVERRSPRGTVFYSCNKYPECRFSVNERPYREECDQCKKAHFFVGTGVKKRVLCCEEKECKFANSAPAPAQAD